METSKYLGKLATRLKTKDYRSTLEIVRGDLKLPSSTSISELEALLIYTINNHYGNRVNTDTTLMALSLLTGTFDNRNTRVEPKEEKELYSARRDLFLRETDYIEQYSKEGSKTYEDAKKCIKDNGKIELDTISNTLNSAATKNIKKILSLIYQDKEGAEEKLRLAKEAYEQYAREKNITQIDWKNCDHIPNAGLPSLCCLKLLSQTDQPEEIANHPEERDGCSAGSEDARAEIQSASQEKREELSEQDASLPLKKPRQQSPVRDTNGLFSSEDHRPNPDTPLEYTKILTIGIREVSKIVQMMMVVMIVIMCLQASVTIYGIKSANESGGEFNNNGSFLPTNYTSKGKIIDDLSSVPPVERLTPNNTEINGQEITRDHIGLIENEVSK